MLRKWFNRDLYQYNLFLMPIGFVDATEVVALPSDTFKRQLVKYLSETIAADSTSGDYNVALTVELKFQRAKATVQSL